MATNVTNSAYKIKVGTEENLVDLVPEKGAIIFNDTTNTFQGSDGTAWYDLSGAVGPSYTFENGLTDTAGTVRLGGDLTQDTEILGAGGTYDYFVREIKEFDFEAGNTAGAAPRSRINMTSTQTLMQTEGAVSQSQLVTSTSSITVMLYFPALMGFFWNNASFQIYDQVNLKGIEYNADYSANFTDRSLVDKGYVDTHIMYENGLTQTGLAVRLGGTLTQNTTVDGAGGSFSLDLEEMSSMILHVGSTVGTFNRSQITMTSAELSLIRQANANVRADVYLTDANVGLAWTFNGLIKSFQINATQMLIRDQQQSKGLIYDGDYSANWTDHSLITKKFVEDTFVPQTDTVILTGTDITNTYSNGVPVAPAEYFDTEAFNQGTAFTVSIPGQSVTINEAGNYQGQVNIVINSATDNDVDIIVRTLLNGGVYRTNTWNSGDTDYDVTIANYIYFPGMAATDVITLEIETNKDADLTIKSSFTELIKTT